MKDVEELQSRNLVDPLLGYSTLSLFPRTFRDLSKATKSEEQDMETIHGYLKSLFNHEKMTEIYVFVHCQALRSPNKLLEKAKTIVKSSSELLNSEFPFHVAAEEKDEAAAANVKYRPQERRPALGRKRARFSLKPNSSQPFVSVEPSLDIDQLQDPEEYFLAHEKLENAKKELQKQRGDILIDSNQYNPSTTARRRRPGILGKTVSYKHHYSSVLADNDKTFMSSQETFELDLPSPSDYGSHPEVTDQHVATQEREMAGDELLNTIQGKGLVAETENRVNNLLDELLSTNCTDLDGDGALTFLQERLQIKPIDLEKLCLPDLDGIRRNNTKASKEELPKPRKALSDIHNMIKRATSKTYVGNWQVTESSILPRASPTPPKSPFASISLLKRHILQTNPSSDPFSALDIDTSPARHSSPVAGFDKQTPLPHIDSSHLDASNSIPVEVDGKRLSFSGKLQSLMREDDNTTGGNTDSGKLVKEDTPGPHTNPMNGNSSRIDTGAEFRSNGLDGELEENDAGSNMVSGELLKEDSARPFDRSVDKNSSRLDTGMDVRSNGSDGDLEDKVEDMVQEAVASDCADLSIEDQSGPAAGAQQATDEPSETRDICVEQNCETNQEPSRKSLNGQSKPKEPPRNRHKRKELSRRQSLAEAGTLWKSGVRRSTRIRMRPLEYWKGERFLYGRIHQSLTTVIGVKYVSPAKGNGMPSVKVKSYVADEFKELVEQAALH
ncbi:hypothetical protein HHK36_025703 [Tetracentron sinense]|uniref:Centromere protein C n=1 Tax=Tetracentron sinense TaxID=13715 RepID=A0A834YLU4_TETSI|nr:hypothetical protein HHK36_025703 [Tetracentron sinense]